MLVTLAPLGACAPRDSAPARAPLAAEGQHGGTPRDPAHAPEAGAATDFARGKAEFERRWVPFPSIGGQWGRGPLSSADSCAACHPRNGRGALPGNADQPGVLLRIGLGHHGQPDPRYGRQLDGEGILGRVPAEGRLRIEWQERQLTLGDGEVITLRRPQAHIDAAAYGPLDAAAVTSLRVAPALAGLGLLEAVDDAELQRLQAAQRSAGLGGEIHRVPDLERRISVTGRFGWKASQPTLRQQAAVAFIDDMGVTSTLFPADQCTAVQQACRDTETVRHPELRPAQLDALSAYLRTLSAPAPRAPERRGEALFNRLNCNTCHAPVLRTTHPHAPRIHPYTDLLLHDLGEGLADGLREVGARGAQWRTAPLWGLAQAAPDDNGLRLLHDGRARDPQEAILWHAGEAAPMAAAYSRLPREERAILLRFLQSL